MKMSRSNDSHIIIANEKQNKSAFMEGWCSSGLFSRSTFFFRAALFVFGIWSRFLYFIVCYDITRKVIFDGVEKRQVRNPFQHIKHIFFRLSVVFSVFEYSEPRPTVWYCRDLGIYLDVINYNFINIADILKRLGIEGDIERDRAE